MSVLVTVLLVAATAGVTSWAGFKCTKESRKLLAEKREEEAKKKAREESEGRERNRLNVQTKEVLELLDHALRDPHRYLADNQYGSLTRGRTKYPELLALTEFLQNHKRLKEINMDQGSRLDAQGKKLRELQEQMREIQKALTMGQPIEF